MSAGIEEMTDSFDIDEVAIAGSIIAVVNGYPVLLAVEKSGMLGGEIK